MGIKMKTKNDKQIFFLMLSLLAITLFLVVNLHAAEKQNLEVNKIKFLIMDSEASIYKIDHSDEYIYELSEAFRSTSSKYNIDVNLLISIGYRESVFRMGEIGDRGKSLGIMQVGKQGRRACACDMTTVYGQIECGACWLDKGREWCGSIEGGLTAYACGKCEPVNGLTRRAVNIRFRLVEMLKEFESKVVTCDKQEVQQ